MSRGGHGPVGAVQPEQGAPIQDIRVPVDYLFPFIHQQKVSVFLLQVVADHRVPQKKALHLLEVRLQTVHRHHDKGRPIGSLRQGDCPHQPVARGDIERASTGAFVFAGLGERCSCGDFQRFGLKQQHDTGGDHAEQQPDDYHSGSYTPHDGKPSFLRTVPATDNRRKGRRRMPLSGEYLPSHEKKSVFMWHP